MDIGSFMSHQIQQWIHLLQLAWNGQTKFCLVPKQKLGLEHDIFKTPAHRCSKASPWLKSVGWE